MSDVPNSWFNEEVDGSGVAGFMCRIDYECELGAAMSGNRVFPSEDDLRRVHTCADDCGIVEVRVKVVRLVSPGTTFASDSDGSGEAGETSGSTEGDSAGPQDIAQ